MGRNIHVDSRGGEIARIRPRENESINQEWLTDKARFRFDGLNEQRLMHPVKRNEDGTLTQISWEEASSVYHNLLNKFDTVETILNETPLQKGGGIGIAVGESTNTETFNQLQNLANRFEQNRSNSKSVDIENRWPKSWRATNNKVDESNWKVNPQTDTFVNFNKRPMLKVRTDSDYSFNQGFRAISNADWVILVGTNPRTEARLLNTRLRAQVRAGYLKVSVIGPVMDLGYEYEHLGET